MRVLFLIKEGMRGQLDLKTRDHCGSNDVKICAGCINSRFSVMQYGISLIFVRFFFAETDVNSGILTSLCFALYLTDLASG